MAKYHINPKTGKAGLCRARSGNCPFGSDEQHFDSLLEAQAAFEKSMASPASKSRKNEVKSTIRRGPQLADLDGKVSLYPHEDLMVKVTGWNHADRVIYYAVGGVNVAAVKLLADDYYSPHPSKDVVMADIETRPEYQHRGHAKRLLAILSEAYGVDRLEHNGGFTADGYTFISKYLHRPQASGEAKITFPEYTSTNPFSFVEDWDKALEKWP